MNVWWISLLSFLAGFAICMAIAGWLVAWQLWRRPSLHDTRLKLALYDPDLLELDEPDEQCCSTTNSLPPLEAVRTVRPGIEAITRKSSPAAQQLVQQVFEKNLAMRESLDALTS